MVPPLDKESGFYSRTSVFLGKGLREPLTEPLSHTRAVVGLMDRALDLKPEVTQGCGFESRLRQEVRDCSPGAAQSAAHCSKCVHLDGLYSV